MADIPINSGGTQPAYGEAVRIRSADPSRDLPAITALFEAGVRAGDWMDNDTGADLHNFQEAYCNANGRSHFWVAELIESSDESEREAASGGAIIGMIGVQQEDEHTVVVRRLRVAPEHQMRGVGTRLMETAVRFCREQGCLKVVLDTRVKHQSAIALFERLNFRLNRQRTVRGETILEFYLDLYREPEKEPDT